MWRFCPIQTAKKVKHFSFWLFQTLVTRGCKKKLLIHWMEPGRSLGLVTTFVWILGIMDVVFGHPVNWGWWSPWASITLLSWKLSFFRYQIDRHPNNFPLHPLACSRTRMPNEKEAKNKPGGGGGAAKKAKAKPKHAPKAAPKVAPKAAPKAAA